MKPATLVVYRGRRAKLPSQAESDRLAFEAYLEDGRRYIREIHEHVERVIAASERAWEREVKCAR